MATCYRHPGRETGVSCSSCGKPICPDCMTPTPVGMRCPDCASQRTKVRDAQSVRRRAASQGWAVTKVLIAINVLAFLVELATGTGGINGVSGSFVDRFALLGRGAYLLDGVPHLGGVAEGQWWRLVTGGFLHAGLLHIGFNMYLLYILGRMMEPALGALRFGAIYAVSLLAGSFGALLVTPNGFTVGASGAIFGLMGAAFIELRSRGIDPFQAGIGWLIVLNLGLSFVIGGISVGGHIGGLIGGVLAGFAFLLAERQRWRLFGLAGCVVLAAVSVVAAIAVSDGPGLG